MLELTAWGHPVLSNAPWLEVDWLDAPPHHHLAYARDGLRSIDALACNGQLTTHGRSLLDFGLDWRSAHMILRCLDISPDTAVAAVVLAALLGERDVLMGAQSVDVRLRFMRCWHTVAGRGWMASVIMQRCAMYSKRWHVCVSVSH